MTQEPHTETEAELPISPAVAENIKAIEAYYAREDERVRPAQRLLERFTMSIGKPWFLGVILLVVIGWVIWNTAAERLGKTAFDPPPFQILEGFISLIALLVTTVVLIGQNRLASLERRREQLELQVNILTEQKTTKLLHLIEELRRDLPMVRDRHDADAATLQQPTDTTSILSALEQRERDDSHERT
jgi:uncharacterized membrane protein